MRPCLAATLAVLAAVCGTSDLAAPLPVAADTATQLKGAAPALAIDRRGAPAAPAPHGRRAPRTTPGSHVCVVTTGCDEVANTSTGEHRLLCAEGASRGSSSVGNATTLRGCIRSANAFSEASAGSAQRIEFAAGITAIRLTRALPTIAAPHTTIDGQQHPGLVHINGVGVPTKKGKGKNDAGLVGSTLLSLHVADVCEHTCGNTHSTIHLPLPKVARLPAGRLAVHGVLLTVVPSLLGMVHAHVRRTCCRYSRRRLPVRKSRVLW